MNHDVSNIDQSDLILRMGLVELAVLVGMGSVAVNSQECINRYLSSFYGKPLAASHSSATVRKLRHLGWLENNGSPDLLLSPNGSAALDAAYGFVVRLIDNGSNLLDCAMLVKMIRTNGGTS